MQSENIYNKDNTRRSCPHGAALSFPVGTVNHIKVGDRNCAKCPCFNGQYIMEVKCCYPNFAPRYGISDN